MGKGDRRRRLRLFLKQVIEEGDATVLDELWGQMQVTRKWGDEFEDYETFKRWTTSAPDRFDGLEIEIEELLIDGNVGAARCQWRGTTTQKHYGIIPAGRTFESNLSVHVTFDGRDRLVEARTDVDFLELLPESSRYARGSFVETVEDGVVVVGENGSVTDINPSARDAFAGDQSQAAVLGTDVTDLLPPDATDPHGENEVTGEDGRVYEVTSSTLTDNWDGEIGRMLVCRDVTDRRQRVQQLQVLSRVLRHNIRNDLNVILGRIETAAAECDRPAAVEELSAARTQAAALLETAETAREIQRVLGDDCRRRRDLVTIVESAVSRFREAWPEASVDLRLPERLPVTATDPLSDAIRELIENAWEHGQTTPRVRVARDGDEAIVRVADDGPGLPERERAAIEAGEETQLKHGSGLGLWFVRWVVTSVGGAFSLESDDGTVATVRLPVDDE